MITVAVVGPESTGKTMLSEALAKYYQVPLVPEFSRTFLNDLPRSYVEKDLIDIAKGQLANQEKAKTQGIDLVIFDTDLLVMKVWSSFKYGRIAPEILEEWEKNKSDFYILTYFDIPYEEDPLRENPEQRAELFEVYENQLKEAGLPYIIAKGNEEERLKTAIAAINNIS